MDTLGGCGLGSVNGAGEDKVQAHFPCSAVQDFPAWFRNPKWRAGALDFTGRYPQQLQGGNVELRGPFAIESHLFAGDDGLGQRRLQLRHRPDIYFTFQANQIPLCIFVARYGQVTYSSGKNMESRARLIPALQIGSSTFLRGNLSSQLSFLA
jgi:hypothetical protein